MNDGKQGPKNHEAELSAVVEVVAQGQPATIDRPTPREVAVGKLGTTTGLGMAAMFWLVADQEVARENPYATAWMAAAGLMLFSAFASGMRNYIRHRGL